MSEILASQNPEQVIDQLRPGHGSVVRLDGGDNRDVFVVDNNEAFRFAKDEGGVEVGRYEFAVLKLLQGRLSVDIPEPIELAEDGSYNVLSFLPGKVLSKYAVTELPLEKRRTFGTDIANVINELNAKVSRDELEAIPTNRSLIRNRDEFYLRTYDLALQQDGEHAAAYREYYSQVQQLRPDGSASNIIVFGDLSSPNLVLSENDKLTGIIDWTELGFGDIHNELRPVFSVIGSEAFEDMVKVINPSLGPINKDLVRLNAIVHELSVLVSGKQKGELTSERTKLGENSIKQWLGEL